MTHLPVHARMFTHLVVLDFEATCQDGQRLEPQEIIEFPMVVLDVASQQSVAEFHRYVRPVVHPQLTGFCTSLTGITQAQVDASETFPQVFKEAQMFIEQQGLYPHNAAVVTCGHWDLRTMLPMQLRVNRQLGCSASAPALLKSWINIKDAYEALYGRTPGSMRGMLQKLDLQLLGRHHSGIDDSSNISRVVVRMLQDGWVPMPDQLVSCSSF